LCFFPLLCYATTVISRLSGTYFMTSKWRYVPAYISMSRRTEAAEYKRDGCVTLDLRTMGGRQLPEKSLNDSEQRKCLRHSHQRNHLIHPSILPLLSRHFLLRNLCIFTSLHPRFLDSDSLPLSNFSNGILSLKSASEKPPLIPLLNFRHPGTIHTSCNTSSDQNVGRKEDG
jgi:hypothetical protein